MGIYLIWRSFRGDQRDHGIRRVAIAFASTKGTSFYEADLSEADFTQAILKNTDLRAKSITHTCWSFAKKLDLARLGNSILSQANVRELLVARYGYKKSYENANLCAANLAGVNLEQADLQFANLSEATLAHANLKDADFTGVEALGTDFTSAYLTGACLESWKIDHRTKLQNVDCQYIFLLENTNELKSDNESESLQRLPYDTEQVFQPGDLSKLYQQVIKSAEISFRKNFLGKVTSDLLREVFQNLMQDNTIIALDSLEGVEKTEEEVWEPLELPENIDKPEIKNQSLETHESLLDAAIEKPILEEKVENKEEKTMKTKINQSRNINIKADTVHVTGAGSLTQGDIEGTVANTINQGTASADYSRLALPQLLGKLKEAIAIETNLTSEEKEDSYDALDDLTTASQETDIKIQKEKGSKALRTLERIVKLLPAGSAFITIFKEIAPHVSSLLKL